MSCLKTILLTFLLRNNENYIPYMFNMFKFLEKSREYNFKYLVYTNDNEDKTLELLQKYKSPNTKIIEEKVPEKIKNLHRTGKLCHLRQKLLLLTKEEKFDYLIMMDSEIFFNLKIIEQAIKELEKQKFEVITSNTLQFSGEYMNFYDTFSYIAEKESTLTLYHDPEERTKFRLIGNFKKGTIPVESSFGGFWLTKYSTFFKKNAQYLDNRSIYSKDLCEHIDFNKNFRLGFSYDINPLWTNKSTEYAKLFKIIKKNNSDNRGESHKYIMFLIFLSILISLIFFLLKI